MKEERFLEIHWTINECFNQWWNHKIINTCGKIILRPNALLLYFSTKSNLNAKRKGRKGKGREGKMKIRKMRGKAANSRATIAARKTNEPAINTRRTIGEAFDLVTPANQSLGRLIPHCTRSRVPVPLVPSAADQTMPDSGKLSKRPFRKNSICTQMKATNWSHPRLRVSASPFFPAVQRFTRGPMSLAILYHSDNARASL